MKGNQESQQDSPWQKTQYANLVRYKSSGVYFARMRVQGKLIRRSLATDSISVAKLRLSDLIAYNHTVTISHSRFKISRVVTLP
jgi:hypothetical protein